MIAICRIAAVRVTLVQLMLVRAAVILIFHDK
jgi:hypothetical protein